MAWVWIPSPVLSFHQISQWLDEKYGRVSAVVRAVRWKSAEMCRNYLEKRQNGSEIHLQPYRQVSETCLERIETYQWEIFHQIRKLKLSEYTDTPVEVSDAYRTRIAPTPVSDTYPIQVTWVKGRIWIT
jgi:hypothetical protein